MEHFGKWHNGQALLACTSVSIYQFELLQWPDLLCKCLKLSWSFQDFNHIWDIKWLLKINFHWEVIHFVPVRGDQVWMFSMRNNNQLYRVNIPANQSGWNLLIWKDWGWTVQKAIMQTLAQLLCCSVLKNIMHIWGCGHIYTWTCAGGYSIKLA